MAYSLLKNHRLEDGKTPESDKLTLKTVALTVGIGTG
jgi:hypothetical protein